MKEKEPISGIYNDIPYESKEEKAILQWLWELKEADYIERIERSQSFCLSEKVVNKYTLRGPRKTREFAQTILREHIYTPEFKIYWNVEKYHDLIWIPVEGDHALKFEHLLVGNVETQELSSNIVTYIEVKPDFDQNNMTREFTINQKWMHSVYSIHINLLKPKRLFAKTFTPKEYLITDKRKVLRKLTWEVRTLEQYLTSQVINPTTDGNDDREGIPSTEY